MVNLTKKTIIITTNKAEVVALTKKKDGVLGFIEGIDTASLADCIKLAGSEENLAKDYIRIYNTDLGNNARTKAMAKVTGKVATKAGKSVDIVGLDKL